MALSASEFEILKVLAAADGKLSQRALSALAGISLGTVNSVLASCVERGLVGDGAITDAGRAALEPHRVRNAVIMAAGLASRFAPISYEQPKGVLKVRGERLVERQVLQLREAGIEDIIVVVGYKRERFFYLKQKYGVRIVVNPDFATKNNVSTLWRVLDDLSNTYICSSDIYYEENPFSSYEYGACYASEYAVGPTRKWCVRTGSGNRITSMEIGGENAWIMLGHAYFDERFSHAFARIVRDEYGRPGTDAKFWEELYREHVRELHMTLHKYPRGFIHEFDSLDELLAFDPNFLETVDTDIFDNIAAVLGCDKAAIHGFYPLKQGLTNLSCHFAAGDDEYVYRHPGVGTEKMIDRASEAAALALARDLGLDSTFIYEDPECGWKLSRFVRNARTLDPTDPLQLKLAMEMCRRLHESGAVLEREFDFVEEGLGYENLLRGHGPIDVLGYDELKNKVLRLKAFADADGYPLCFNHNDFFMLNFLIDEEGAVDLIDWEYAGMSDVANDFGTFTVCCELTDDRAEEALAYYFGRPPSFEERRHFWSYVVFAGWCWYVWSLEKEAEGDNVGDWLFTYYRYAADNVDKVLGWYEHGAKE